jgi:hypothetical protein
MLSGSVQCVKGRRKTPLRHWRIDQFARNGDWGTFQGQGKVVIVMVGMGPGAAGSRPVCGDAFHRAFELSVARQPDQPHRGAE